VCGIWHEDREVTFLLELLAIGSDVEEKDEWEVRRKQDQGSAMDRTAKLSMPVV